MAKKVVPMIHVPDVAATVAWYERLGFEVINTFTDDGEGLDWAMLSFGGGQLMFSEGGAPASKDRREVDLYIYVDNVDERFSQLKDRVAVVESLHDTFYGMREFIIRDLNGFWLTFGEVSPLQNLLNAIRARDIEGVRAALDGRLRPEALTSALDAPALDVGENSEIIKLLEQAGGQRPPTVDATILQSYVGRYESEQGSRVDIAFENGRLFAAPGVQDPLRLIAINETTFRPAAFDGVIITFKSEGDGTMGFEMKQGSHTMRHRRVHSSVAH
jgi:uncharacterized glyoxalase superfamily protein PhnB